MAVIGLVQLAIVEDDWEGNFREALRHMNALVRKGAECVVLPEMWTSLSRTHRDELARWSRDKLDFFRDWASENHAYVIFSQLEQSRAHFYNTAYAISPSGDIAGSYRKAHLFALGGETTWCTPGHKPPMIIQTPWGKWAVAICFDLRFPIMFRRLARQGVSCVIIPAQWPERRADHWLALLVARAIENQCVMVGVNRLGSKNGDAFHGASTVIDPWGKPLLRLPKHRHRGLVKINFSEVERIRAQFPCLSLDHPSVD